MPLLDRGANVICHRGVVLRLLRRILYLLILVMMVLVQLTLYL